MKSYVTVTATFSPQRADDLRLGAAEHIGWRGQWRSEFQIDAGPYAGQFAMQAVGGVAPSSAWVLECGLTAVVSVDPAAGNG